MDDKLTKFSKYLSKYKAVHFENGIEVAWGHDIVTHMDDALYTELKLLFKPLGIRNGMNVRYYIVTKELTHEDLVAMLGRFTKEVRGPNGGFKSITFKDKTFYSRSLAAPKRPNKSL